MPHVLVVEDDPPIADAVQYALRRDGMTVEVAGTVATARTKLRVADLVVLDLTLPDGSGFSILDDVRRDPGPRVIVLTSRDEDVDCVAALEAGADDFVSKPFSPRALVARVRAVLRRTGDRATKQPTKASGLAVDVDRRRATYAGRELPLTKLEFDLLSVLAESPGLVKTRGQIVEKVWGTAYALTERTVDSHLKGLRRKLEEAGAPPGLVETVRGVGFRLQEGA